MANKVIIYPIDLYLYDSLKAVVRDRDDEGRYYADLVMHWLMSGEGWFENFYEEMHTLPETMGLTEGDDELKLFEDVRDDVIDYVMDTHYLWSGYFQGLIRDYSHIWEVNTIPTVSRRAGLIAIHIDVVE